MLPNMRGLMESKDQMQSLGEALSNTPQWEAYCDGLKGWNRSMTAILLENQRQFQEHEMNEVTKILSIGNWDKYSFPMIRAVYPNLASNELVSVQPMAGPVSLIFYLDYLYGTTKGSITSGVSAFDARTGGTGNESYSGDAVINETATLSSNNIAHTLSRTPLRPGTIVITGTSAGGAFTIVDDGNGVLVVQVGTETVGTGTVNYNTGAVSLDLTNNITAATISYRYDSEANDVVPQIDLQLTSAPVTALVRKLRARWSLEAAQNLNALHGMDAESELVGVMAEVIKQELDREVINDLYNFAGAGSIQWDKTVPAGISYTEHKLSFVDACISLNNKVYSATKRIQTNWIVASIAVCDIIESLPGFAPVPGAAGTQANSGIMKIGTLNNRWTVFKDPFLTSGKWIQGYKGDSFLDAGYVYAPYVPLYTTPTVILDDFIGRRGIGVQYGKKSINNKMYAIGSVTNF